MELVFMSVNPRACCCLRDSLLYRPHYWGESKKKQISCQGKTDNGNGTKTDPNCPAFSPLLPLRLAALKGPLTDATEDCRTKCNVGMKRPPNGPVSPKSSVLGKLH